MRVVLGPRPVSSSPSPSPSLPNHTATTTTTAARTHFAYDCSSETSMCAIEEDATSQSASR